MLKAKTATMFRVECDTCGQAAEDIDGYDWWWDSEAEARGTARDAEFAGINDRDVCGGCTRGFIVDAIDSPSEQSDFDAVMTGEVSR
ncbi:MAG: hypothetical protein ACRD0P_37230, partial [Stackebrandtia sp.]